MSEDASKLFREYLKLYKFTAKLAIERMELISGVEPNSSEQRIHTEVMNKEIKPKLEEYGRLIYSAILSYNKNPTDVPSLTTEDIQEAQLVQDEVSSMLGKVGIHIQYARDANTY